MVQAPVYLCVRLPLSTGATTAVWQLALATRMFFGVLEHSVSPPTLCDSCVLSVSRPMLYVQGAAVA